LIYPLHSTKAFRDEPSNSMRRESTRPYLDGRFLILAAAALWGTTGTSQALAPESASSLTIGALRVIIGSVPLLLLAILRGGFRSGTRWHIPTVLMAGFSTAAYQIFFFNGVRLAGVAIGTLVGIGSTPIFAGLLGRFFEKEKLSGRWVSATLLTICGCVMLSGFGSQSSADSASFLGLVLALAAGFTYAIFTLVNKRLLAHHTPDESMAVSFCLGALILLPVIFLKDISWVMTSNGAVVVLHLGLLATGVSYMLFGRGLRTVAVSTVGTLTLAEPLTAGILSVLLLGERLSPLSFFGIILLITGLLILTLQPGTGDSEKEKRG
jgi:drug/metabolite transporter, DME family